MEPTADSSPETQSNLRKLQIPFLLFCFSFVVLYLVYWHRIHVLNVPFGQLGSRDQWEYRAMALSLLNGEGFTYFDFSLRPPVYPLFIALIYSFVPDNYVFVLWLQLPLAAASVVLAYKIAYLLTRSRAIALLTGILLAIEPSHLDTASSVMSETIHNLCLLIAIYYLVRQLRDKRMIYAIAHGFFAGLAFLSRAVTVYLPLLTSGVLLVYKPRSWKKALAAFTAALVLGSLWSYRNFVEAGFFSISGTGSYTLLFYKMVSVESRATGRDPQDVAADYAYQVEQRLGNTNITRDELFDNAVGRTENLHPDSARKAVIDQLAREKVFDYPVWFTIMTLVATVLLYEPVPLIPIPIAIQIIYTGGLLVFCIMGIVCSLRDHSYDLCVIGGCVILYYVALTSLSMSGLVQTRFRTPFMPFLIMFSAYGIVWLFTNPLPSILHGGRNNHIMIASTNRS